MRVALGLTLCGAALLFGCGSPATSRFQSGDEATLFWEGHEAVLVGVPEGTGDVFDNLHVPMGTRVVVVRDDEGTTDDNGRRTVWINIMEGPYAGRSGKVDRSELRPK